MKNKIQNAEADAIMASLAFSMSCSGSWVPRGKGRWQKLRKHKFMTKTTNILCKSTHMSTIDKLSMISFRVPVLGDHSQHDSGPLWNVWTAQLLFVYSTIFDSTEIFASSHAPPRSIFVGGSSTSDSLRDAELQHHSKIQDIWMLRVETC